MAGKKRLSEKHKLFIDAYMETLNATRAYMKVYPRSGYEAARRDASRLLTKADIKAEIAKRFEARAMPKEEVLARLSDMARASHYPFIEIDDEGFVYFDFASEEARNHLHLIKKIKTKRNRQVLGKGEDAEIWEGEWVEVELHDAKDALKLIGQHEKLFNPDPGDEDKFTAPQIVEIIRTYEKEKKDE